MGFSTTLCMFFHVSFLLFLSFSLSWHILRFWKKKREKNISKLITKISFIELNLFPRLRVTTLNTGVSESWRKELLRCLRILLAWETSSALFVDELIMVNGHIEESEFVLKLQSSFGNCIYIYRAFDRTHTSKGPNSLLKKNSHER